MERNELAVREIESTNYLVKAFMGTRDMRHVTEEAKTIATELASKYIDASRDTLTQEQKILDTLDDPLSLQDRGKFGTIEKTWQDTLRKLPGNAFRKEKEQLAELRMRAIMAQREFRLQCPPPEQWQKEIFWEDTQSVIADAIHSITATSFLAFRVLQHYDKDVREKYNFNSYNQSFRLNGVPKNL